MARRAYTYRANRRRSPDAFRAWWAQRVVPPRPSPLVWVAIKPPSNGVRECARRARQVAAGSLRAENGLRVTGALLP
jgi:hypothetical protein